MSGKVFKFTWKIKNFEMLLSDSRSSFHIKSPVFVDPNWEKEWKIIISSYDDQVMVALRYYNKKPLDITANWVFFLASIEPSTVERVQGSSKECVQEVIAVKEILLKKHLYMPQDVLTLHCYLLSTDEDSSEHTAVEYLKCASNIVKADCVAHTCIPVFQKSINWSFPKLNDRRDWNDIKTIKIPSLLVESNNCDLVLKLAETLDSDYLKIDIHFNCAEPNKNKYYVKCKITVTSAIKKYRDFKESIKYFDSYGSCFETWSFPNFIRTSYLDGDHYLLKDGTLQLLFEFSISKKNLVHHNKTIYAPFSSTRDEDIKIGELSKDIGNLFAAGKFCDVDLRSSEGEIFKAQKLVLCARSSVFRAMFENDMIEKTSNVVEIDVDSATLKRMLAILHCDVISEAVTRTDASKLYEAADKYNITFLKDLCTKLMLSYLTTENVCDVLVLADTHQDNVLMAAVRDFINSNKEEIFRSSHWESFMDLFPKLSGEIMHQMWCLSFK